MRFREQSSVDIHQPNWHRDDRSRHRNRSISNNRTRHSSNSLRRELNDAGHRSRSPRPNDTRSERQPRRPSIIRYETPKGSTERPPNREEKSAERSQPLRRSSQSCDRAEEQHMDGRTNVHTTESSSRPMPIATTSIPPQSKPISSLKSILKKTRASEGHPSTTVFDLLRSSHDDMRPFFDRNKWPSTAMASKELLPYIDCDDIPDDYSLDIHLVSTQVRAMMNFKSIKISDVKDDDLKKLFRDYVIEMGSENGTASTSNGRTAMPTSKKSVSAPGIRTRPLAMSSSRIDRTELLNDIE